jgi:hypothetical protein
MLHRVQGEHSSVARLRSPAAVARLRSLPSGWMSVDGSTLIKVSAQGHELAAGPPRANGPVEFELGAESFTVRVADQDPVTANYRDLTTIAVDQGRVLLVLGGEYRLLVEQLGTALGTLLGALRDRRARQLLHDRFIEPDPRAAIELVEYAVGTDHGVAQIAYHAWGFALLPVDERQPWRLVRRAGIAAVSADMAGGWVEVQLNDVDGPSSIQLPGLGTNAERHRASLAALREAAHGDTATIITALMPDAPFAARQKAAQLLIDGRPVSPDQLGDAWPPTQRAVLVDPGFARTYAALVARGTVAGQPAPQWLAISPATPGGFDDVRMWFFVGLPGNLVAMELVQQGSHATYLFRIVHRPDYHGQAPAELVNELARAVARVSDCLIDARFLREPIYLTDAALQDGRYLRYRLAIAALPSLQAARARFVGRLIHRADDSWAAALEDAIKWNAASRDDAATWPGGATDVESDDAADPNVHSATGEGT